MWREITLLERLKFLNCTSQMCRVRRAGGTQTSNNWWLSPQNIQEKGEKAEKAEGWCKVGPQLSAGVYTQQAGRTESKKTQLCTENCSRWKSQAQKTLSAENPSTTKPVPSATAPIAYVQDGPCCPLTAIYGSFAFPYIFITLDGLSLGSPHSFECQFGIFLLYMVKGARGMLCLEDMQWIRSNMWWEIYKSKTGL